MEKLTKRNKYEMLLSIEEVKNNEVLVNFIKHEIELLDKKSSKKNTKKNEENERIKNEIIMVLNDHDEAITVTEIAKELDGDYSNQKISALVNQLAKEGEVEKITEKSKSKFKAKA